MIGPVAVRDGARREVRIAAANQAQGAADAAIGIGRRVGQNARLKGEVRSQAGQRQGGGEELGVRCGNEEMVGFSS